MIGLETAGGQDDRTGLYLSGLAVLLDPDAVYTVIVRQQCGDPGAITDLNTVRAGCTGQCLHQARTTAPGFDRQATPELEPAIDLERLAAPDRREADALGRHP